MTTVKRVAWLIALTCLAARLITYPLDGLMWRILHENFYLSRAFKKRFECCIAALAEHCSCLDFGTNQPHTGLEMANP
jgi:hypothetical protein